RIEEGYIDEAERLEKQSQTYLKEIEAAKFHEQRGKINCECYRCVESKRIQGEIKAQLLKEDKTKKEQCLECKKWVKELDEEAGVCKGCKREYE
ncbi:7804_t:CDS:1, partial [Paraglomus occultum]